jgi:hypothetical protein
LSRRDKKNACQKLSLLYCRAATIMPPLRPQPYHPDCRAALTLIVALQLVLAHIEIDEKSNEIPAVQKLLAELDVAGHIVTCDAMHCQKKLSRPPPPPRRI